MTHLRMELVATPGHSVWRRLTGPALRQSLVVLGNRGVLSIGLGKWVTALAANLFA